MKIEEEIEIINESKCVVDEKLLSKLIAKRARLLNKPVKKHYRITARDNSYARVCIAHTWIMVHRLLGEYLYGEVGSNHIHHEDGNKLNNSIENLILLSPSEHAKETNMVQYVSEKHMKGFGERSREFIKRHDVTTERVNELLEKGHSKVEISQLLKCGTNTVYRRLGMKDY